MSLGSCARAATLLLLGAAWLALATGPTRAGVPVPPMVCGQLHTGTLSGPGDVAELSFEGLPGDLVTIAAWRTDTGGTLPHTVLRPDGTTLAGPASFRQNHTLAQDGTLGTPHRVQVTTGGAAAGPFAVQIHWLNERAECQDDLACGVRDAGSLTAAWHWRTWSFDGLSGQRIGFQTWRTGGDAAFAPRWRLYRPNGTWVQSAFQVGLPADPTLVLDTDGIHTIVVKPENASVGDLSAQLLRFEDSGTPTFASCGPLLLCGQPVGLPAADLGEDTEASPAREWETFRLDAGAGEVIGIDSWRTGGDADFRPEHRVFDRSGNALGAFGAGFVDWTFPAAGTYTVAVKSLDSPPRIGTFGLEVWRLSDPGQCAALLPCGQVELVTHDVPGVTHTRQFAADAGETFAIETRAIEGAGLGVEAALYEPDGALAAAFQPGRFSWPVAQTGTHTVVARAISPTASGSFAIFWEGLGPANLCSVVDADADSVPDDADNCPVDPNPGQEDADLDQLGDDCDNCPDDANPDQSDLDSDSFGDVCEPTERETRCLVRHLKALGKMCKSAFACEAKRVKKPAKDPSGNVRDACRDRAEERFEKTAGKAHNKLGPCLMPANYLTVATSLGSDALTLGDSVLLGFDEASPDDAKARAAILKSLGKGCLARLKADGKAVKKGIPLADTALVGFATKCDKSVVNSEGVYDGTSCASLSVLLEDLLEDLQKLGRGR